MSDPYCIAIHVPVYVDGPRMFAASEWRRALYLLRDSLSDRFIRFTLVAPTRPVAGNEGRLTLEPLGVDDGFDVIPSVPLDGGKRRYWLGGDRARWRRDVARGLAGAAVAHTGLGDLYRPLNLDALRLALAAPVTTVFVRDTDEVTKMRNLIATGAIRGGPDRSLYLKVYDRALKNAVAHADLSLLKGRALFDRYGPGARNPKLFHDTSYALSEIVSADRIAERTASLADGRPIRLVYCGRLVDRKGCDRSIRIVADAVGRGADITYDLIGDGPERRRLEGLAAGLNLGDRVRFLGERPYGSALLGDLSGYDGLLFTPLSEDTPRMIFDGYAAGLPLVGFDIPYVRERAAEEGATETLPFEDVAGSATRLAALAADRTRLADLAMAAHRAAGRNASDVWYRRRADWTFDALDRRLAAVA